jgi:alpha-mannosidase
VATADGASLVSQEEEGRLVVLPDLKPLSALTVQKGSRAAARPKRVPEPADAPAVLENDLICYELEPSGRLARAYDKVAQREALARSGAGNVLSLYNDGPLSFDAWDVDIFYEKQLLSVLSASSFRRIAAGPVRTGYRFEYAVGSSSISQEVFLSARSRRLDFRTRVDWRERRKILRVSFEVDVVAEDATYDIQYGSIRRPTHRNTTWDMARFEVCGHRFADLSEDEYGVALLNDCKYGYKVLGRRMDLNLLRATTNPDPEADLGAHLFTYSLLPHQGRLAASDVLREAAKLNQGVLTLDGFGRGAGSGGSFRAPCAVEGDGIVLAVLKRAEKEARFVVRIYEAKGRRARGKLVVADAKAKVVETSLLEWEDTPVKAEAGVVDLELKPFEIRTYKIG